MNIETTVNQIGGERALFMMGCKEKVVSHNSLTLRIKSKSVRYIKIELNGLDYYDVSFFSGRMTRLEEERIENVSCDCLKTLIEHKTGLSLSL